MTDRPTDRINRQTDRYEGSYRNDTSKKSKIRILKCEGMIGIIIVLLEMKMEGVLGNPAARYWLK